MNTAQQLATLAQKDFGAAIRTAVATGVRGAVWFAGCEYTFTDGSVLTLRAGRIESPTPKPIGWTQELRAQYDV